MMTLNSFLWRLISNQSKNVNVSLHLFFQLFVCLFKAFLKKEHHFKQHFSDSIQIFLFICPTLCCGDEPAAECLNVSEQRLDQLLNNISGFGAFFSLWSLAGVMRMETPSRPTQCAFQLSHSTYHIHIVICRGPTTCTGSLLGRSRVRVRVTQS
jgi:hypothetical protein